MVRSCYTLLGSTIRIRELVQNAKNLGFSSVALTDRNVMYGAASFAHACSEAGIKPLFGLELDVQIEADTVPFLLLAKTNTGFRNLMHLSSLYCCEEKPVPFEQFRDSLEGIFLIVYAEGGWFDSPMILENTEAISEKLSWLKEALPPFDVAMSFMEAPLWQKKNQNVRSVCRKMKIHTCALSKVFYLGRNDAVLIQMMECIKLQLFYPDSAHPAVNGRHMLSIPEMEALYPEDELQRTDEIAAMCHAEAIISTTSIPSFPVPAEVTSDQYLTKLCLAGLNKRLNGQMKEEYRQRLKYELDTIIRMHFSDYFLIVYDFIRYARKKGICVGPGRGSAAGSLVAYCLGITMIDPIRYGLLFERFLNPSRVTMPDIDTDIPDDRREEVIQYVAEKYGLNHTASIVTFNTFGAKQVLRDTGRALKIDQRDIDMLCRMIPNQVKITLREALVSNPKLKQVVAAEKRYRELFWFAMRLEGLPRHTSIHAAGIVLSGRPLEEVIPVMKQESGMMTSQFSAEYLEERGLIKMDFLGLRNLSMLASMEKKISEESPTFSLRTIPEWDAPTLKLFCKADTSGIFQFESEGMKRLLRQIQPGKFEDIVAAMALYRPASTDSIPTYIRNKQNPAEIRYPSRELVPVLEETYGVMVYQEQGMKTAQIAAGFSLADADRLRKAMSKKNEKELLAMKDSFVSGCRRNGYSKEQAEELFELVRRFGGYGFNKSHAVAYGRIAWESAFIKANYPLCFYSSLIDSTLGDSQKISQYVDELRRRGIRVERPDVNSSCSMCSAEESSIRLPISVIRGVGSHVADVIEQEQQKRPFTDFFDFIARISVCRVTRTVFESLIDAGALDSFHETRTTMREGLDEAIAYAELIRIDDSKGVQLNFDIVSKPSLMKRYDEKEEIREREMAVLGFTLGEHPIIDVRRKNGIMRDVLVNLKSEQGTVKGFGYADSYRTHQTKRGARMAFMHVNDETADLDLLIMPKQFEQYSANLRKGIYILFDGKMTDDGKCIVNTLKTVQ